jgi:dTDP-4-amino-4,6-dideoxygalactose transaminase
MAEPPTDIVDELYGALPAGKSGEVPLPLHRIHRTARELAYVEEAMEGGHLSANGPFTERCTGWLEEHLGAARVLLTSSCSAALEFAAELAGLGPGDEVVMPSFTSVATASAVVRRGATPVFADIRPDTLNLDESAVAEAVTARTRAIVPVHYAGVACEMQALGAIAQEHRLLVIEDAAHGVDSTYRGRPLGAIGDAGCLSFHEKKNLSCGEGGALILRDERWVDRSEILQETGTNRRAFLRGRVDRYTWVDIGSSCLLSEISAAVLWAQLQSAADITARRLEVWQAYHSRLGGLERAGRLRRPIVPDDRGFNAHIYYLLLPGRGARDRAIATLAARGIGAAFHYVPLHSSPAGRRHGRIHRELSTTERVSDSLVRLPLWPDMTDDNVDRVVEGVAAALA